MHNIPQVERIAAVLRETGLSEPAVEKLAASLVEPEPGTVTPQEVASADASVLILLAAIIALTRIREDRDAPSHLLQFLGPRESELDAFSRGRYWHLRGYVAWRLDGSIYRAYTALNRSIRLLEGVDDHGYLARVWDTYGQLLHYQGLISAARLDYEHALELRRRNADESGAALTLGNLARVSMELGDFASAAGYLRQDLEIVERLSPSLTGLRTQLHSHLGICLLENGDPEAALAQFQECLRLVGDDLRTPAAAFAQIGLARVALARGKGGFLEAEQSLVQARACDTGDELFLGIRDELKANIAYVSGDIHWARDDTSAAGDDYRIALAHFDESLTSSPVEHAQLLHKLARVELRERRRLEGAQLLREALKHLDATAMDQLRNDVEKELKEASREIWLLHCAGRFLGQGQLDLLLEQAGQRGFQGAQEDMVILFSDIRSFTSISEQLAPCDLIQVLNDYLSHMTRCIERFGGIVDKFIGDAVMALFPPDESGLSGAERASRAALMMRAELEHFNRTLPEDMPRFEIGVGLHTGQVVVGLIGSPQKRSYTAIGDPVNTASRLEGMTKALGAGILVSRELCEQLPADTFLLRPLGRFRPKGRDEAVEVFDLMLEADGSLDALEVATEVERCQTMLAELYNRHFAWATEAFLGMAEGEGDTAKGRGYRFLADHARDMVTQPPPVAWGGEITLTEK